MVVPIAFKLTMRLVTKRSHGKIMKQLNRELMERIRDLFWPRHFENNADTAPGGAYGYARLSRRYLAYKQKKFGHNLPLVLTGALAAHIKNPGGSKITATQNGATLRSRSPHFLRLRHKSELEAVSPREKRDLAEWAGKRYVELAHSPAYQETIIREPAAL